MASAGVTVVPEAEVVAPFFGSGAPGEGACAELDFLCAESKPPEALKALLEFDEKPWVFTLFFEAPERLREVDSGFGFSSRSQPAKRNLSSEIGSGLEEKGPFSDGFEAAEGFSLVGSVDMTTPSVLVDAIPKHCVWQYLCCVSPYSAL
jgi:hypothetical protein